MFRRDQKTDPLIDSLVSGTTRIQGDVQFSGGLHLDGAVTGSVRAAAGAPSRLVVSESAVIEGSVEAEVVELHGTVRGDIFRPRPRHAGPPGACGGQPALWRD